VIRQGTATEKDAISADERVVSDRNRSGGLAAVFKVNAMRQNLRSKARKRAESSNNDSACAVDEMAIRDGGVLSDYEIRFPVALVCKVLVATRRESTYPIGSADGSVLLQV